MSADVTNTNEGIKIDWTRLIALFTGVGLFMIVYYSPPWPDAVDPVGKHFPLPQQGKGAIAVFLLAGIWWVFEVVPIGVTSLVIGVTQALFMIRTPAKAFKDFMDPAVLFIFASLVIGLVFTKTGLTKRMAYKMLGWIGEKTTAIYLGVFVLITILTHFMAHTAVAATMYPLLLAINSLYDEGDKPTRFGKGLFIGMAYVCGAGSIITLLGSARAIVALGFFKEMAGVDTPFYLLTYYMAPIGWLMVILLWVFFVIFFKPEKRVISGLRERVAELSKQMGPITRTEILSLVIIPAADLDLTDLKVDGGREFVTCVLECVFDLFEIIWSGIDRQDLLAGANPGSSPHSFSKGKTHTFRHTVRTGTRCLLILAKHVVGKDPYLEVKVRPADFLHQAPVGCDTSCLKCAVPDLA